MEHIEEYNKQSPCCCCSTWTHLKLNCCLSPGSLVVEKGPSRPPLNAAPPGARAEAPSVGASTAQQRQSTLAQLQLQVTLVFYLQLANIILHEKHQLAEFSCLCSGGQTFQSAPQARPRCRSCCCLQLLVMVPELQVRGTSWAPATVTSYSRRLLSFPSATQSGSTVRRPARCHKEPDVVSAAQSPIPAQSGVHKEHICTYICIYMFVCFKRKVPSTKI